MKPIRLLVVDDHSLFRRGLVALLGQDERFVVIDEAADLGEALRCLARGLPDLILLDNHLPGVLGVDGIAALKDAAPAVRVLMLTVSENEDDLAAALQAGADGYLLKTIELDRLSVLMLKVLAGESVISPEMVSKLVGAFRGKVPAPTVITSPENVEALTCGSCPDSGALDALSSREREVLLLISQGDSNKHIARKLDIAETTVKIHVQHILRKLQLSSRVQAAVYAAAHQLR